MWIAQAGRVMVIGQTAERWTDRQTDWHRWSCGSFFSLWVSHEPAHQKSLPWVKSFTIQESWGFWSDGLTDRRTDKGGHAGHFSHLQLVMNLHAKNGCSRSTPSWSKAPDRKGSANGPDTQTHTQTDRHTDFCMSIFLDMLKWMQVVWPSSNP